MRNAILLVVLFVSLVSFPQSRQFLAPYFQTALNPLYRMEANHKIKELTDRLETERDAGRKVPLPKEFSAFLATTFSATMQPVDPWGTPYYLAGDRFNIRVGSAGPDREQGTDDDVLGRRITVNRVR